ncbi:MAG: HEPN domain-containing protein [Dehalococcoidia bacterium]|nr:MAG: HEPN domain-containing protein [Dehalococcoidia bacterium]
MMTEPLSKFVEASLKRADECLKGAKILLKEGQLHRAVSRAYYGVFHAAKAILHTRGIKAKTHSGARALFGEHIVKPGIMGKESADILRNLSNARQLSDYEVHAELDRDELERLITQPDKFLGAVKEILRSG